MASIFLNEKIESGEKVDPTFFPALLTETETRAMKNSNKDLSI